LQVGFRRSVVRALQPGKAADALQVRPVIPSAMTQTRLRHVLVVAAA